MSGDEEKGYRVGEVEDIEGRVEVPVRDECSGFELGGPQLYLIQRSGYLLLFKAADCPRGSPPASAAP